MSRVASATGTTASMSRADRFEDEKRRIVESCFSKLDGNGQLAESYITHIRILEDSASPSAPSAPENVLPENMKPRLIIVAVRSTGRVRMHKARENNNGSFSIGKTWNLEELSAIESFSNSPNIPPQTETEAQYRAWAGSTGFIVTIGKPYYWQAGTSKEKDFFIASTVKIYRKYTKGQVPELRGFDDQSKSGMLGLSSGPTQPNQSPQAQQSRQLSPMPPHLQQPSPGPLRDPSQQSRYPSPMAPPQPPQQLRPASPASQQSPRPQSRQRSPMAPQQLRPASPPSHPQSLRPASPSSQPPQLPQARSLSPMGLLPQLQPPSSAPQPPSEPQPREVSPIRPPSPQSRVSEVLPIRQPPPQAQAREVSPITEPSRKPRSPSPPPPRQQEQPTPAREPQMQAKNDDFVEKTSTEKVVEDEEYRPGLGPMIKKNAVRDRFRKAANAANAFHPRPGGAAEKILRAKAEREEGSRPKTPEIPERGDLAEEKVRTPPKLASPMQPKLEKEPVTLIETPQMPETQERDDVPEEPVNEQQNQASQAQAKMNRRNEKREKYCSAIGIDYRVLESKGIEFEEALEEFGWDDEALSSRAVAQMEERIRRELSRLETGSWLNHEDPLHEKLVEEAHAKFDKAIAQCDEMDARLTLYSMELGTLAPDIAFIEAQDKGLQIYSANQKLLFNELKNMIDTVNLDRRVFECLRNEELGSTTGLQEVEGCLVQLCNALVMINPSLRSSNTANSRPKSRAGGTDYSHMRCVREHKDDYERESEYFLKRLLQHLDHVFASAFTNAQPHALQSLKPGTTVRRLNQDTYTNAKRGLWIYEAVLLYAKEMDQRAWDALLSLYLSRAQSFYAQTFRESLAGWKQSLRTPGPEEERQLAEALFTHADRDANTGGIGSAAARKLTVKRSQTLAKSLRSTPSDISRRRSESFGRGKPWPMQVFASVVDEMAPLVVQEQNFIVALFHASNLETGDFVDFVSTTPPDVRTGKDVRQPKPMDPDREMASRVTGIISEAFGFFAQDIRTLLEAAVSTTPLHCIGVMASLCKHAFFLHNTGQEFLQNMFASMKERLIAVWSRFIDEQVRAIEDTKIKTKKRKGVIDFMEVFPSFSMSLETCFMMIAGDDYDGPAASMLEVREMLDATYERVNRAMFESLKAIAKQDHGAGTTTGGEDSEDKDMLNYHILLIENMSHYIDEVDDGGKEGVLASWRGKAMLERAEAMDAYVGMVIRRPLGKLLDFLDSTDALLASHPTNPAAITARPSYSRKAARSMLSQYDGREVRRGMEALRKRVVKHFGGDESSSAAGVAASSSPLVEAVWKAVGQAFEHTFERAEKLVREAYPPTEGEKDVVVPFSRAEVAGEFGRNSGGGGGGL